MTIVECSNCEKELLAGERNYCEKSSTSECAECTYHALLGRRTTKEYNEWLRSGAREKAPQ